MATNVNYYTQYTSLTVTGTETWGAQDIDGDGIGDGGTLPLEMKILPDPDYYVLANMFTMKGYEPTSIGPDGQRIWEDGETTTDVNGDSVVVDFGNIEKVEMYDSTNTAVSTYDPTSVYFPPNLNPTSMCDSSITNLYYPDGLQSGTNICDGSDATVMISVQEENILLDGTPIATGDVVGVFKYEIDGTYKCYGFIVWDNAQMPPAAITVRGLNSYNTLGFSESDEMHVFVKQASADGDIFKMDVSWVVSDGIWGWSQGPWYEDGGLYQITEFTNSTNWSESDLIFENNNVVVNAWLNSNYVIQSSNIELILDIDGDAELIEPIAVTPVETGNPQQVSISLAMSDNAVQSPSAVVTQTSNCIIHVFARTGYEYTSGNHTIPALPWASNIVGNNDVWAEVIDIPETGVGGKATITIQTTAINVDGRLVAAPRPEGGYYGLGNLFCFIVEPIQGYALHQGMVCPGRMLKDPFPTDVTTPASPDVLAQITQDESVGNLYTLEDYSPTNIYGDGGSHGVIQSMDQFPNWLSYEIYPGANSDGFGVVPFTSMEDLENADYNQWGGNNYHWWPSFSTQWKAIHMTSPGTSGLQLSWDTPSSFTSAYTPLRTSESGDGGNYLTHEQWWSTGFFPVNQPTNQFSGEKYYRPSYFSQYPGVTGGSGTMLIFGGSFNPNGPNIANAGNSFGEDENQGRPIRIFNTLKDGPLGANNLWSQNNYSGVSSNSYPDFVDNNYSNLSSYPTSDWVGNCVVVDLANNLDDKQLAINPGTTGQLHLTLVGGAHPIEQFEMPSGGFEFTLEEQ